MSRHIPTSMLTPEKAQERRAYANKKMKEWRLKNPEKALAQSRAWRAKNKDRIRQNQMNWRADKQGLMRLYKARARAKRCPVQHKFAVIKSKYGLSRIEYLGIMDRQSGCCGICKKEFSGPRDTHIDHDHSTEAVRGILCHRCNTGLGFFADKKENLLSAFHYLNRDIAERLLILG